MIENSRDDSEIEVVPMPIDRSEINLLDDLLNVGPEKPLGYLPLIHLVHESQVDLDQLQKYLEQKGLVVKLYSEEESKTRSGAMYAYDKKSLQKLLDENIPTLNKANWPIEASEFVEKVVSTQAERGTAIFNLIADAFADYTNKNVDAMVQCSTCQKWILPTNYCPNCGAKNERNN